MDTLRSVGVHAEALVENVSARGDKAKEIAACVEGKCVLFTFSIIFFGSNFLLRMRSEKAGGLKSAS